MQRMKLQDAYDREQCEKVSPTKDLLVSTNSTRCHSNAQNAPCLT